MQTLKHTRAFTRRRTLELLRQPWFVAVTLVQPVVWLLLFGALCKKVVEIPGFHGGSYIGFLMPGVVVMTAFFSAGWSGMALIEDINRGILDRLLASPARRTAVSLGGVVSNALSIVVQALVIVGLGVAAGARPHNGVLGIGTLLLVAVLIGSAFAALSNALALVTRQEESLIGAVQMLLLPLTFLSATFMQRSLLPDWIQSVARFNPMNWAVDAARAGISSGADWGLVGSRIGFLAALSLACSALATRAFRVYQRSL